MGPVVDATQEGRPTPGSHAVPRVRRRRRRSSSVRRPRPVLVTSSGWHSALPSCRTAGCHPAARSRGRPLAGPGTCAVHRSRPAGLPGFTRTTPAHAHASTVCPPAPARGLSGLAPQRRSASAGRSAGRAETESFVSPRCCASMVGVDLRREWVPAGGAVRHRDDTGPWGRECYVGECFVGGNLHFQAAAMWLTTAMRFLPLSLMTGGLASGTVWAGRPTVLTTRLAAGPPTGRGPGRRQVVIVLEAARGVAAVESWMPAGGPPRVDQPRRCDHGIRWATQPEWPSLLSGRGFA